MKYVCDIVVKKFTFAISSPVEFFFVTYVLSTYLYDTIRYDTIQIYVRSKADEMASLI